jgi:acetyltransferase-like isoleucine patch superfamily enzyme
MNYKIFPNVKLGKNIKIGEYCILGNPPRNKKEGELELVIGDNALIRSHTIIYAGNKIGKNFQTGHGAIIRENNVIGDNVSVGCLAVIEDENIIGNNVRIHTKASIGGNAKIEDNVFIGPHANLLNDLHPPCPRYKECMGGPIIKTGAKIGVGAIIFPGVVIGEHAIVGAGSVVTKNVPPYKVVAGNPARVIKDVKELKCVKGFYKRAYEWEKILG